MTMTMPSCAVQVPHAARRVHAWHRGAEQHVDQEGADRPLGELVHEHRLPADEVLQSRRGTPELRPVPNVITVTVFENRLKRIDPGIPGTLRVWWQGMRKRRIAPLDVLF